MPRARVPLSLPLPSADPGRLQNLGPQHRFRCCRKLEPEPNPVCGRRHRVPCRQDGVSPGARGSQRRQLAPAAGRGTHPGLRSRIQRLRHQLEPGPQRRGRCRLPRPRPLLARPALVALRGRGSQPLLRGRRARALPPRRRRLPARLLLPCGAWTGRPHRARSQRLGPEPGKWGARGRGTRRSRPRAWPRQGPAERLPPP